MSRKLIGLSVFGWTGPRLVAAASLLAIGCAGGLPAPTTAHVDAVRTRDPEATLANLSHGRELYVSKCSGCHALKDPSAFSPDAWRDEVEQMRAKQGVRLESAEARDIVRYLSAASLLAPR